MPSPLLHVAAGASICLLDPVGRRAGGARYVCVVLAASMLADGDILPGFVLGAPNRFHSGPSHSLLAAVIGGLLLGQLVPAARLRAMLAATLAWTMHVLLDALVYDSRPPLGVTWAWPVSDHTIYVPLLSGFRHGGETATVGTFLSEVFSSQNLRTMAVEAVLGLVLVLAASWLGRRRPGSTGSSPSAIRQQPDP